MAVPDKSIKILSSRDRAKGSIFDRTEEYASNVEEVADKTLKLFRGLTSNLEDDIKNLTAKERVEMVIKMMPSFVKLNEQIQSNANISDDEKAVKSLFTTVD